MLSEMKRSGQGQNITVTVGQSFKRGIIFCYLKWKREHRDLEIEQLMSADSADKILSSDWIVSLNLCSNWLVNLLKEEFQKWRQTDKQTSWSDSLLNCLLSQLKINGGGQTRIQKCFPNIYGNKNIKMDCNVSITTFGRIV